MLCFSANEAAASDAFCKFDAYESVNPAKAGTLPLGTTFAKYISNAFMKCEIVDAKVKVYLEAMSSQLQDRLIEDKVNMGDNKALTDWLCAMYQERDKEEKSMRLDIENAVILICEGSTENSFSFTDLLRNLDNSLIEVGAQNNPFGPLRQNLISALKKIAYIKSVTPQSHSGIDEEYELCSPGILIVPLAPDIFDLELNARNVRVSLDEAKKSYQLSAFDRQIGWSRMLEMLEKICDGNGDEKMLDDLERLAKTIADTALCGLGQTAPNPILSTLRYFKDEYIAHVRDKKCPSGTCRKLFQLTITDACIGCTKCKRNCPVGAISGEIKQKHVIDQSKCIKCGACIDGCPKKAIVKD